MKRVLCILSSLDVGGAETFIMKIFRALPENYKIDFVVSTKTGYYESEVLNLGGKIYRIPLRTKHPIKSFSNLKKIVKQNNYKYILKLSDTPIAYFDLLAAKLGGAQNLCIRSCNASSDESKIKHIINSLLRQPFNQIANIKIAPSKLAANYTFGEKIVDNGEVKFIHNAVDLDTYKYSKLCRDAIRKEFSINKDQLVIGHIGRFNYQKNHKFLLDIFKEILNKKPDAILLLVGDGDLKEKIKQKIIELDIEKSVIFTGIRPDIPSMLSAFDIMIFPSYYEGMPNTVIEAQATGLPSIISDAITEEAAITDIIKYISLEQDANYWAEASLEMVNNIRRDTTQDFLFAKYDIQSTVHDFINIIFSDEN